MLCPSCGTEAGDISKFCPACGSTVVRLAEADDQLGKIIANKFRIEQVIGEGGMGKVYRAKQVALDKPVVLKVLRRTLLSDERTVARFQREARAASRLNHPNSISVLDFGQAADGALYIAMEFVAGKDLHQILSQEWPLPEVRIVRIVSQVLSALADAHSAGVIHRDLKPENIMVEQRRGEPDFVKVLDFGIAKIQDSTGEQETALTRAGFVCGTPEYMSPEQARGAPLDHRSDLYAVGVILYQLCAGLLPFDSDSAVGFATKHLSEEPLPPSRRRPEAKISPGMERLILKALSKDPKDRPQSADAFRAELLALDKERSAIDGPRRSHVTAVLQAPPRPGAAVSLADEPTRLKAPAARGAVADKKRSAPWALGSAVAASLAIALGLGGYYAYQARSEGTRGRSDSEISPTGAPKSDRRPLYEQEIAPANRDSFGSTQLAREGDQAQQRGELDAAAIKYQGAFRKNPTPELSLKLGEMLYQSGRLQEARGWWQRHLRDRGQSKARRYIQQVLGEPLEGSGTP